jgi:hypothetical protein
MKIYSIYDAVSRLLNLLYLFSAILIYSNVASDNVVTSFDMIIRKYLDMASNPT